LIKLVSTSFIHVVVWAIVLLVLLVSGIRPQLGWLLVPYYFFAMFALLLGIGRITALVTPFFRDLGQMVGVALQFGFWLTPVLWPLDNAPERFRWLLALNPVFYVVDGLRGALLPGAASFAEPARLAGFWGLVAVLYVAGRILSTRLRPHLADVL
jgi:ABC-type polysaccharide/polyol phosphate export permease